MRWPIVLYLTTGVAALHKIPRHIPGLAKIQAQKEIEQANLIKEIVDFPDIVQANLTQPLDHFDPSNGITFEQRYWYSLRHYKPQHGKANPIFILDSGETNGEGRLPYLDHGILDILARETGGIGVVLEHRYYGSSIPDRKALGSGNTWGVDQLRWLNNRQALEDSARFVQKMKFGDNLDLINLKSPESPVIYYGGSYPGARAAHMRILYPELIFGAIASSAVVVAIEEFPDYFYPISRGAQQNCVQAIQSSIAWIDTILAPEPWKGQAQDSRDQVKVEQLLKVFGLEGLKNPADFANLLSFPLGEFQGLNWDSSVTSNGFEEFCTALVGEPSGAVSPAPQSQTFQLQAEPDYLVKNGENEIQSPPLKISGKEVPKFVQNYAQYIKDNFVKACAKYNATNEECFGTSDYRHYYNSTDLDDLISWTFQYCSTWGYLMTAPPYPKKVDGVLTYKPSGPKLISSLMDLDYASEVCKRGFPKGEHFTMPKHPNVKEVNDLGGFDIAKDRLAFINGQYDPWRPATTASEEHAYGGSRLDTTLQPSILIANCWHHCDENGNRTLEPPRVVKVHEQQIHFVKEWLKEWKV